MATAVANSVTALETSKTRVLVVGYVYRKPAAATLLRSPKTSHVSTHEEQLRQAGLDPDNLLQSLRAKRCLRFDKALVVPSTPPPRQEEIESVSIHYPCYLLRR